MLNFVDHIKNSAQMRWNRIHLFQPKIKIEIDNSSYQIKTATSSKELIESFKLRHQVFKIELSDNKIDNGLDYDKFDHCFDHLIILHKQTKKIIGTYRLHCSMDLHRSYSSSEFNLAPLKQLYIGPWLELGRACIHPQYRKGAVISLLWRGIAEYMNQTQANTLFGCSSLKLNDAREAALVYQYAAQKGYIDHQVLCQTKENYRMDNFDIWSAYYQHGLTEAQVQEAHALIPPLLYSYVKLGAKIVSEPAEDRDFSCVDFLTILQKKNLSSFLTQKYQLL